MMIAPRPYSGSHRVSIQNLDPYPKVNSHELPMSPTMAKMPLPTVPATPITIKSKRVRCRTSLSLLASISTTANGLDYHQQRYKWGEQKGRSLSFEFCDRSILMVNSKQETPLPFPGKRSKDVSRHKPIAIPGCHS